MQLGVIQTNRIIKRVAGGGVIDVTVDLHNEPTCPNAD